MSSKIIDTDSILSENEEWMKLEEDWKAVDLETEEDCTPNLKRSFSNLDLRQTTFDSSFLFKKVRRKVGRELSKASALLDYKDFIMDLETKKKTERQFYFINGQIISAVSVEEICNNIDEVFKSIEKLTSAPDTMKKKKVKELPERVECSISTEGLSFDETPDSEREKHDSDNIDRFIDEAFDKLSYTMMSVCDNNDAKESVTTLVNRFSSILNNPTINCSRRRQRECCSKFKELADFWERLAFDCTE